MDALNPNFKKYKAPDLPQASELFKDLQLGKRAALSRALTLVESKHQSHRALAEKLVQLALPHSGESIRIGITGVPGVGKSTFIEAFGTLLTKLGKKVAVLAVDPSSSNNRGSILGDKTRMHNLSQNPQAFIRPSPSAGSLGGVAHKSRESILLCEAAGYDVILIETVGVGQSETAVKHMVDFFMLLMLSGAGDELQGIKRGIMEMADLLVVNKADGNNQVKAKQAASEYKRALHLFPPKKNEWITAVQTCSALEQLGMESIWETITSFENHQRLKGFFKENRTDQNLHWFEEALGHMVLDTFYQSAKNKLDNYKEAVKKGEMEAYKAARELVKKLIKKSR